MDDRFLNVADAGNPPTITESAQTVTATTGQVVVTVDRIWW